MSPPVHGVYARVCRPGNHVRPQYVEKFIEGGSPAPESPRSAHEFTAWALCCRWLPWPRPIARRVGLRPMPAGVNIRLVKRRPLAADARFPGGDDRALGAGRPLDLQPPPATAWATLLPCCSSMTAPRSAAGR